MSSVRSRVFCTLRKLRLPWDKLGHYDRIWYTFAGIDNRIKVFELEFMFLTLFRDCIHKGGDAKLLVAALATAVEATIQEIVRQVEGKAVESFGKTLLEIEEGRRFMFFRRRNLQKRASEILDIFTKFNEKINILKAEIRAGCEKLFLSHSSWSHFDDCEEFLSTLCSLMRHVRQEHATDQVVPVFGDFRRDLLNLKSYVDRLPDIPSAQGVRIHIENMANHAAVLICQFWASRFDRNMNRDLISALLGLERKIFFMDPESFAKILRLLESLKPMGNHTSKLDTRFLEQVRCFLHHLLLFKRVFLECRRRIVLNDEDLSVKFMMQMQALTINTLKDLKKTGKDAELEQTFLPELQLLISEAERSFSFPLPGDGTQLLDLHAKAWLIKMKVLIVKQLTAGDDFLRTVNKQIRALKKGLQKIKEVPGNQSENVAKILVLTKEVVKLVPSLHQSFLAKHITEGMVRTVLLLLLLKILYFNLDRKLRGSSILIVNDRVEAFLRSFKLLINSFRDQQWWIIKDGVLELAKIEVITRRVISFYHSLLTHDGEDIMENMNIMLPEDLLDEIYNIMLKLKEIYILVPKSDFPTTNALGFFDSLLSKMRELLTYEDNLFAFVKQHIKEVLGHLELFRCFLGDILEHEGEIQELRDLAGNVIDIAYKAAYLVDSIVGGHRSECHHSIWLYFFLLDIRHTKMQIANVQQRKIYDVKMQKMPHISKHLLSKNSSPRMEDIVLSLGDQQEVIINRLVRGSLQCDTVSIVGMAGVGKTTLAKKVYNNPTVAYYFHIQAWCCVTQIYRKRELLLEILSHIIVLTDNIIGMSNEDLDFKLYWLLSKKKYLIVLDDMWSTEAWDDLQRCFPDDEIGSRILITSRLNHVALKAKAHTDPHHLRLLSNAESWALLQMKVFHKECCPQELIEVGKEVAKSCKGLPLAIVTMAGILKRTDRQQNIWKEIAENLSSRILDDPQEQCREILELSYNLLPDHLQACFLYFGAFLEDKEIPVRKLIRLWIAEGFVQKTELKILEDVAEDYLKDLIGRSLVIFARPRSRGGTKTCRVHDMLRSLCQSKAKQDNFFQVISRSNESDISSDDLDFIVDTDLSESSNHKTYEDYRLCFYSKRYHFVESRPSGPYARSLLFFATGDKYARSSYDISFICHSFGFLRVLDLEFINMGPSFPGGIELMVHLRYLAVSGDVDSVPSSIAKLQYLETLVVIGLKGKVSLPETIWCLKRLRHLHITDVGLINVQDTKLGNSSALNCFVKLSSLFLRCGEETNNFLSKFPNLRKLGCMFSHSADCADSCNLSPTFDVLTQLESLKMSYHGRVLHTAEFILPLSLKKLTLSNFRLPWSHIFSIERLPNLEVLKLLSGAYDGETWDMADVEFYHLKFLKLDGLNIVKWNASSDNIPKLEQLVLRNCKHLEEVPSSFVEIATLHTIEVQWCGKHAEESARRMREEADEYLKVIITSDLDSCNCSSYHLMSPER